MHAANVKSGYVCWPCWAIEPTSMLVANYCTSNENWTFWSCTHTQRQYHFTL